MNRTYKSATQQLSKRVANAGNQITMLNPDRYRYQCVNAQYPRSLTVKNLTLNIENGTLNIFSAGLFVAAVLVKKTPDGYRGNN